MRIYFEKAIRQAICLEHNFLSLMEIQKKAFIDFSKGLMQVPLPLQLNFEGPPGDCHVKAGHHFGDDLFFIKIATGFYDNNRSGLPSGDGVVLAFSKKHGFLEGILQDGSYLTQLRTALAACVAAQVRPVHGIGIVGTGSLAGHTLQLMSLLYPSCPILVWGREIEKAKRLCRTYKMAKATISLPQLLLTADVVITSTASKNPLIYLEEVKRPLHIIALGADEAGKQELDPALFSKANLIMVDSKRQAQCIGDVS